MSAGVDFFKRNKNVYGWEDLYCRGKSTFLFGGPYSFKIRSSCIILFDPHNNSIKLGKIVISVPILQVKKNEIQS